MPRFQHGMHWLEDGHRHGQCISCGESALCHIEPGAPDCTDLCIACERAYLDDKAAQAAEEATEIAALERICAL